LLTSFPPNDDNLHRTWEALGTGTPTIAALAALCGQALRGDAPGAGGPLSIEAKAILYAARERGLLEVKAVNTAFETPERLLAVHVELEPERGLVFRRRQDPQFTIRCMEGFRQLCSAGLVLHHLYREFSLSQRGFAVARSINAADIQEILEQAVEYG